MGRASVRPFLYYPIERERENMNTFKINGKTLTAKPVDFGMMVELEDRGITAEEIASKKFRLVKVYVALCAGCSDEEAVALINEDPQALPMVLEAFMKEVDASGFFQKLNAGAETENATVPTKASKK